MREVGEAANLQVQIGCPFGDHGVKQGIRISSRVSCESRSDNPAMLIMEYRVSSRFNPGIRNMEGMSGIPGFRSTVK